MRKVAAVTKTVRKPMLKFVDDEPYSRPMAIPQMSMITGQSTAPACDLNWKGQMPHNPLTKKGKKIMASMKSEYGSEKGESVFYKSANKGRIKGVHK